MALAMTSRSGISHDLDAFETFLDGKANFASRVVGKGINCPVVFFEPTTAGLPCWFS